MNRRHLIQAAIGASACSVAGTPAWAETKKELVFGVCDAVSYKASDAESMERFFTLQKDIGKSLGEKVKLERIDSYDRLTHALSAGSLDLAFIHPCHHAVAALASGNYHLGAVSKAHLGYKAHFLVLKDSPLKRIQDLAGKQVSLPDADSATSWLARASVAEGIPVKQNRPVYTSQKYQEAVAVAVKLKVCEAGATGSDAEVRQWLEAGNKVLASSKAVPVKQFLVHSRLQSQLEQIRAFLVEQSDLAKIGVTEGFVAGDEKALLKAGEWLATGKA